MKSSYEYSISLEECFLLKQRLFIYKVLIDKQILCYVRTLCQAFLQ